MRQLLEQIRARIRSIASSGPTPSSPYPDLLQRRSTLRAVPERRQWLMEKVATAQLLGNVRVKLRTYGLRGYEPPEGLTIEVSQSLPWSGSR